jgi:hypothetical protein
MIVQTARPGKQPVVICNDDHAFTAAQFAARFGNFGFVRPAFAELLTLVTHNHEAGWRAIDAEPRRDPETGLPYHLADTPMPLLLQKSVAGPDFNTAVHPWCGLLSSMHCRGLFNGRYGLSDAIAISAKPPEYAEAIETMLAGEEARQRQLKTAMRGDPQTSPWVEGAELMRAYKLLEFFDRLALHFQLHGDGLRDDARFPNVPTGGNEGDLPVSLTMLDAATARLSPYPFDTPSFDVYCRVRAIEPAGTDEELLKALAAAPWRLQRYTVRAPYDVESEPQRTVRAALNQYTNYRQCHVV